MSINLVNLNGTLCNGIRLVVSVRRLAKDVGLDCPKLGSLEREVREAAGAVQKYMDELKAEGKPLILK